MHVQCILTIFVLPLFKQGNLTENQILLFRGVLYAKCFRIIRVEILFCGCKETNNSTKLEISLL